MREHEAKAWLVRKARDRRWWPTDAGERSVLKELADFAAVATSPGCWAAGSTGRPSDVPRQIG
eukprot:13557818-Alexandrium_andersonii.AAC.1